MSKAKGIIEDVLSRVRPMKFSLSWLDRLPEDIQAEMMELKRRLTDGEIELNPTQLARAITEACSARGHAMPRPRQVREWLVTQKA
jgi:hypothetical protein